jgi:Xaa-Pro dipeptidase
LETHGSSNFDQRDMRFDAEHKTELLQKAELDGIVCSLPENILFLTGYWPSTGDSLLLYPAEGNPCLIIPSVDRPFVPSDEQLDVREYDIDTEDILFARTRTKLLSLIKQAMADRRLGKTRLGIEASFETVAGSFRGSEVNVPGRPFFQELEGQFPEARWVDASTLLKESRQIKTPEQIALIRRCHEIAAHAFALGKKRAQPGVREIEVASTIESAFQEYGVGYAGVQRARGYAFVMSGRVNAANAWLPANFSTGRCLESGDLVLVEFNGYADGYWADLSRTFVVGEPNERQAQLKASVRRVLDSVIAEITPGTKGSALDQKARSLMEEESLADYFPHYIGHGVGLAFHEPPILSKGFDVTLREGMVLAIEPGVYLPNFGGLRIEQNVAVTQAKAEVLSDFDTEL